MGTVKNIFYHAQDPVAVLTEMGYVFNISEATDSGTCTGPTSYATTSPTLLARVTATSALTFVPLYLLMFQAGTVAGGAITFINAVDNANRYTSGGTEATYLNANLNIKTNTPPTGFNMYSTTGSAIVATDANGIKLAGRLLGQDVSPAEGAVQDIRYSWKDGGPEFLSADGTLGASWLINTSAGTTGPTWHWSAKVAVFPTAAL